MNPTDAIKHLLDLGFSESAIAARLGSTQSTINRIRNGKQRPTWCLGQSLIDLAISASQLPEADRAA